MEVGVFFREALVRGFGGHLGLFLISLLVWDVDNSVEGEVRIEDLGRTAMLIFGVALSVKSDVASFFSGSNPSFTINQHNISVQLYLQKLLQQAILTAPC